MDKTLLQKLDAELPPFWCAAWAREKSHGKKAGPATISERSGISYRSVQRISSQITWAGVDIAIVSAFIHACGLRMQTVNIIRMNEIHAYQRWCAQKAIRPFKHLNNHQFKLFCERSKKWIEAQGKKQ